MNTIQINISFIHTKTKIVYEGTIILTGDYPNCNLLFTSSVSRNIEVKGHDFFQCLINLRIELEKQNYFVLCNGARQDVCCGGMLREYSNGRKGNIMKLGQYLNEDDEICIFDYAEPDLIVSINEQKDFYKLYCSSLPDYPNEADN